MSADREPSGNHETRPNALGLSPRRPFTIGNTKGAKIPETLQKTRSPMVVMTDGTRAAV